MSNAGRSVAPLLIAGVGAPSGAGYSTRGRRSVGLASSVVQCVAQREKSTGRRRRGAGSVALSSAAETRVHFFLPGSC